MITELITEVAEEVLQEQKEKQKKEKMIIVARVDGWTEACFNYLDGFCPVDTLKYIKEQTDNINWVKEIFDMYHQPYDDDINYYYDIKKDRIVDGTEKEEVKCCKCNKVCDQDDDYSEYKFDGKKELYCDECNKEHISEYCVSLKDYKEYWDEDYEYDEELEDEFMYLSVKGFDNPRDAKWEYSIMWDGDERGKQTGINTSSVFALMCCNTWECESD